MKSNVAHAATRRPADPAASSRKSCTQDLLRPAGRRARSKRSPGKVQKLAWQGQEVAGQVGPSTLSRLEEHHGHCIGRTSQPTECDASSSFSGALPTCMRCSPRRTTFSSPAPTNSVHDLAIQVIARIDITIGCNPWDELPEWRTATRGCPPASDVMAPSCANVPSPNQPFPLSAAPAGGGSPLRPRGRCI